MSERPAPLIIAADRRPSFEVRGDVSRTIGRASGEAASGARGKKAVTRPPGAGLTLRERRIKKILLKELEKLKKGEGGGGLSYAEKQKLEKTLDVGFIDAELAKMDQFDRRMKLLRNWAAIPVIVIAVAATAWNLASGQPFDAIFPALWPALIGFSLLMQAKANKRKRWIYEALRELSDADDLDVQLPESVALADLLIDRIVEAEDATSGVPLRRTRA
ncbi:hypothetical protein [Rubricoccus marinus]|uniref:Uncharacterized protein n=1 Tax=Rubricoccus marinus TaxID=716817 RepID=A0A259U0U5_9BACT|nr:hypothetical protein [Rubricoccus marinus]OZC03444.1 hypothetical protein BSZ36_10905 [Rubricoccus marinus]